MNLSPLPIQKFFGNNGRPLNGGKLFTYVAGTTTKIDTYTDSSGVTKNTNPIILDFRGECRLWLDPTLTYKFVLSPPWDSDPPTNPIWTVDNITVSPQPFDNTAIATGTANAISLTIPRISVPVPFTRVIFKAILTNTGPTTLQINGGTAHPITWQNTGLLGGGEIQANGFYEVIFDGGQWQLQGPTLFPWNMRSASEIAAVVTPTSYSYAHAGPILNVLRYGAVGNGVTDDSPAIRRAVDVAQVSGGTIYFPPGPYKWAMGSQVIISSRFPVHLIGNMSSTPDATPDSSYIKPLVGIVGSCFQYLSPNVGNPAAGGAGIVRGLAFLDDTNRTISLTAALDLDAFATGIIDSCCFHKLLGSAIRYGFAIQCKIVNLHIRYCGDTSKPAQLHLSTGLYQTQGCVFSNVISEVNYNAPHILMAANSNDNKWVGMTFETSDTLVTEEFNYITFLGLRNIVVGATFNRRPPGGYAVEFAAGAGRCVVSSCVFELGRGRGISFTGDRNEVSDGHCVGDTSVNDPVVFVGVRNRLTGMHFFATRSFDINSADNEVSGCVFDTGVETAGYYLTVTANGTRSKVLGNKFVGLPAGLGGLSIEAEGVYTDNDLSGGGGGSTGINVNSANAIVTSNYIANFTTNLNPNGVINTSIIEDNIGFVRRNQGATASVADGGTINHGLSGTPASALATCSVSGQIVTIGALSATQITVGIKNHDGTAGTTQTIHWNAAL